jgi:hypothetical protein
MRETQTRLLRLAACAITLSTRVLPTDNTSMEFADGPIPLKALRHSFRLHLLTPLAVFVVSEMLIARTWRAPTSPRMGDSCLPTPWLAVVYATFIVVLGFVLNEQERAEVKDIGALEGALKNASHYFAVSTTFMRESFEPAAQVHLARVVSVRDTNEHRAEVGANSPHSPAKMLSGRARQ